MNTLVSGHFKLYIDGLVEQKKAIGYPYETSARILKAFDTFCMTYYPDEITLTKDMAMHWAEQKQGEQVNNLIRRITPVRQLAKYILRLGIEAYVIPPGIPGKRSRYVPHIFTDQELCSSSSPRKVSNAQSSR
jgi:integrase/recombinase XerD